MLVMKNWFQVKFGGATGENVLFPGYFEQTGYRNLIICLGWGFVNLSHYDVLGQPLHTM